MTDNQLKQPTIVSRQDLYDQVWVTPMMQLAEQYGISGNGLAKICRLLVIRLLGRGYWARKQAGQKVSQVPLRDAPARVALQVRIAPSLPPAPPPRLSTELEEKFAAARELTSCLKVSEKLLRPHPVIAAWLEERKRRREEARRDTWRSISDVPDFLAVDRRRHRFLDALFKALERSNFKAKTGERSEVYLEVERERIEFELKEKYRQVRRPLTDDEKKWHHNPDRPWRQELQPTGTLALTIKTHLDPALTHAGSTRPTSRSRPSCRISSPRCCWPGRSSLGAAANTRAEKRRLEQSAAAMKSSNGARRTTTAGSISWGTHIAGGTPKSRGNS